MNKKNGGDNIAKNSSKPKIQTLKIKVVPTSDGGFTVHTATTPKMTDPKNFKKGEHKKMLDYIGKMAKTMHI